MGIKKSHFSKTKLFILPLVLDFEYIDGNILDAWVDLVDFNLIIHTNSRSLKLENHSNFKGFSEKEDYIKYNFTIDEGNYQDVDNFIKGKYSKFNIASKKKICEFYSKLHKKKPDELIIYKVLFKTPDRKEYLEELLDVKLDSNAELLSIPNLEEELYDGENE